MSQRLGFIPDTSLPLWGIDFDDTTRRKLEDKGKFPRRVRLNERVTAYVDAEIAAWIERRIAERDAKLAGAQS